MSDYVVWMDSAKAHVFELNLKGIKTSEIKKEDIAHRGSEPLFSEICKSLHDCDKLLIMGPGLAKNQFKSYLSEHFTHSLAKHLVGVETCDHPTDNQILAISRKFFVHYDLFNEPMLPNRARG